jgi:hypothetical protein
MNIEININFSGATNTLDYNKSNLTYTILGAGTLAANYTIANSITPFVGMKYTFYYKATVDKSSYNFSILGTDLSTTQLNRESTIEAVYNGTSWDLNITPNSVSPNWIDTDDIIPTYYTLVIPVSFESGEQAHNTILLNNSVTFHFGNITVVKAIAGTDDASIDFGNFNGTTFNSDTVVPIPASSSLNTNINFSLSSLNVIWPKYLQLRASKSTAGGKVLVSLMYTID